MSHDSLFRTVPNHLGVPRYESDGTRRSISLICQRCSPLWPLICLVAVATACCLSGCTTESDSNTGINVELDLTPTPPTTGDAEVVVTLTDSANEPVKGARIELEGNMNHAGMKPVFSKLKETESGKYGGTLTFTMGGDWFVLVTGELADGTQVNEKVDVPGVKAQ